TRPPTDFPRRPLRNPNTRPTDHCDPHLNRRSTPHPHTSIRPDESEPTALATPRTVSFSELQTARQCPLKHQLSYVERWTKDPDLMSALSKGTAWHMVLEEHYREIKHHQDAAQQLGRDWRENLGTIGRLCRERVAALISDVIEPRGAELADLIRWMYEGFLARWGLDEEWRILAVEHQATCRLPTPRGAPSQFKLKMKIDLVVGQRTPSGQRQILVVDHKTLDDETSIPTRRGLIRLGD